MISDSSDISDNFQRRTYPSSSASTLPCYAETTVGELVRGAQQGDRQAFGELAERYQRAVYLTVYRRLHNHDEALEVSQDVLIQAMRKIGQIQDADCFGSWLRSIADRMAINRALRRKAVLAADPGMFETDCIDATTPLADMLARERSEQVHLGLQRLRALDRQTLTAFYLDGSSLLEMSSRFSSPVGTIKRRLHVARKRLAKELETISCG